MTKLRIIFMGTPDFAVPSLRALIEAEYDIAAAVTQPDRPAGRGGALQASPVKRLALEHGLQVLQPATLRDKEVVAQLRALEPQIVVVAAFGQILRQAVLDMPPLGCLNVHASLLPRWRGASPIAAAILAGDAETGVTIMKMDRGLDTGPIISQRAEPVRSDDTTATLGGRLAIIGASLLLETLPGWASGRLVARPQPEEGVTVTRLLKKEDGLLDWQKPAEELERQIRAYTPWPGSYSCWGKMTLKVLRAHVVYGNGKEQPGVVERLPEQDAPLAVGTGRGYLALDEVQLEGKRAMPAAAFLNGYKQILGATLGCEAS